jgi:HD-GYP domain-containing protein (c-di-GMP phosphodiesterase class II)
MSTTDHDATKAPPSPDPTELWPALHRRLQKLGDGSLATGSDFQAQLIRINNELIQALRGRPDDSLFVLVQMLHDLRHGYSATHALLSAVTCQLTGPSAGLEGERLDTLSRAALTMNLGMRELQDRLAHQTQPLDMDQRVQIERHPAEGASLLRRLSVTDETWLSLVEDHHETPDGQGYPKGKPVRDPLQHLLRMSDLFVARISPRKSRRGLAPNVAIRELYLEMRNHAGQLGALFTKQMGMYPPGSYVRLQSGETAVVIRRGERVNCPLTVAVADPLGVPLSPPQVRDTQLPGLGIKRYVGPEEVRVRIDLVRLLDRL